MNVRRCRSTAKRGFRLNLFSSATLILGTGIVGPLAPAAAAPAKPLPPEVRAYFDNARKECREAGDKLHVTSEDGFAETADFNGDGKPDLAVANNGTSTVSVLLNITTSSSMAPGSILAPQNTPLDQPNLLPFDVRMAIRVDNSGIDTSGQGFKLQYALRGSAASCSAVAASSYANVTTTSKVAYYNDSQFSSGQTIAASADDPTDSGRTIVPQTFQMSNDFTNAVAPLYAGQDGLWQFSLAINGTTPRGSDICLRVALASDTTPSISALNVPDIAYAPMMDRLMGHGNWFSRSTGKKQSLVL